MHRLLQEENPYSDAQQKPKESLFIDNYQTISVRRDRDNPGFIGSKLISAREVQSATSDNDNNSFTEEQMEEAP